MMTSQLSSTESTNFAVALNIDFSESREMLGVEKFIHLLDLFDNERSCARNVDYV